MEDTSAQGSSDEEVPSVEGNRSSQDRMEPDEQKVPAGVDEEREDDNYCPICLGEEDEGETASDAEGSAGSTSNITMVRAACGHKYCMSCAERILAMSPSPSRHSLDHPQMGDLHLNVPTHGRCPICRCEINLFELQHAETGTYVVPKDHDIANSPIQGMVFCKDVVGNESIHFPSASKDHDSEEGGQNSDDAKTPFLNMEDMFLPTPWHRGDGLLTRGRYYFEPNSHFHHKTSTFHGTIRWDKQPFKNKHGHDMSETLPCKLRVQNSQQWDYILGFSSEFHFISKGAVVFRKVVCEDPRCSDFSCKFPLDGQWDVTWPETGEQTTILVNGDELGSLKPAVRDDLTRLAIDFEDPRHPKICDDRLVKVQSCSSGVDLIAFPRGPKVGEAIRWEATSDRPAMVWTRKSTTMDCPVLDVRSFGAEDRRVARYVRADARSESTAAACRTYRRDILWGNSFCQAMTVGLASYHFLENETAYISYEHEQTSVWPSLDNGSPIPNKIYFTETSYDNDERIFGGKIDWLDSQGTTWQGCRYWRYEIKFSRDFAFICGGHVLSVSLSSTVEQDMSRFVEDLFYINVGKFEQLQTGESTGDYQRAVRDVAEQLDEIVESEHSTTHASLMAQHTVQRLQRTRINYPSSFADR